MLKASGSGISMERHAYILSGQVQGVGFRPFVYRTARRLGLTGLVGNTSRGVRVEVQGTSEALKAFARALRHDLPPLARITSWQRKELPPVREQDFRIIASAEPAAGQGSHNVLVSPDVATCPDCLADIADPANRRYGYAFTNCTNCGPRYTITHSIPYDRATTTMSCFPLCPGCRAEYDNPGDRRFHAQPNACPVCGPRLWLVEPAGGDCAGSETAPPPVSPADTVQRAAEALAKGAILAIKGLGGFLLACDASSTLAVSELRRRKRRPHRALAVMVPDLPTARRVAVLTRHEEELLSGRERPVVVVRRLALPDIIAPDVDSVGLMLPYTPLHHLLLAAFARLTETPPALVMTSGNAGGEPIALGNREALRRLAGIADLFLLHDRDILIRADDSVVRLLRPLDGTRPQLHFLRRARGFVPRPLTLPLSGAVHDPVILGVGAELKNTLCLTRKNEAFVSQHIGDLKNPETFTFFQETASHLASLLEVRPEVVVRDRHPDYLSSAFAEEYGRSAGIPVLHLQHHFAHVYAVLAEHGHEGPALGLALDGTGLGDDGSVWGGELLLVHPAAVCPSRPSPGQRLGRIMPFPLPGGEAAVREPWRVASALFGLPAHHDMSLPSPESRGTGGTADLLPFLASVPDRHATHAAIAEMVRADLARRSEGRNSILPWTSSCGRLFDAVAAMLGLCDVITYEGQAAIRLEQAQDRSSEAGFGTMPSLVRQGTGGLLELDAHAFFLHLAAMRQHGASVGQVARCFHLGLADNLAELAALAAARVGISTIALSGGVMHNVTLARHLPQALARRDLVPLMHLHLPPGDGCIALGQVAWARRVRAHSSSSSVTT